ncbi:MAG: signal transduction histidine kinase, LytS [Acidobacteriaceae bacterium]|nr:signal transduction histidine kinase, LytS [Acidobacteriaceae bacterium]
MDVSAPGTRLPRWFWIAAIWFGVGLFDATQTVFTMRAEGMHHAWARLFFTLLFAWLPLALATPVILALGRRYPPWQLWAVSAWLIHLLSCCAICLIASAWTASFEALLNPWADPSGPGTLSHLIFFKFLSGLISYLVLYIAVLGIGYALESRERLAHQQTETARLNEQLSKAQLSALRRQLEPHFLFNALNSIAGLIRENRNDAAVNMIAGLSDFLRHVVEDSNRQEVQLGEEIQYLQKYLDIQKVRFADRLALTLQVPSELLRSQVPSLILQPMVENALKHGISRRAQGGEIRISAFRLNGMLTLKVYNDGPSLAADYEGTGSGVGISNTRARLRSLYGDSFELKLQNQGSHGVEASVSVPFREK